MFLDPSIDDEDMPNVYSPGDNDDVPPGKLFMCMISVIPLLCCVMCFRPIDS